MRWEQSVQYASISDIGFRRRNNQDTVAVQICSDQEAWIKHGHLFLVADGMGGHAVGELASKIAADTVPHTFFKSRNLEPTLALKRAIEVANSTIYERGSLNRDFERMGTTCTALVLSASGAVIGHVGDSRLYRIRGDRIDQLTFDHSLQWELLRQGRMKPEEIFLHEPRHVITRSLGPEPAVEVDMEGPYPVLPGDTYLLCSDGLTGHLHDTEIGAIARELSPGEACRLLVNLANLRGGSDNVTVVITRVGRCPNGLAAPDLPGQSPQDEGVPWWWLTAFWGLASTFVAGVSATLFGRLIAGLSLTAFSVAAVLGLLVFWWKSRRPVPATVSEASAETVLWRPYRTAVARLGRKFLNHLAAVEAELQRTAGEEGWPIDRAAHEAAFQEAQTAVGERRSADALRGYGKAIDVLMTGLQLQRKQRRRAGKGEKTTPAAQEGSSR